MQNCSHNSVLPCLRAFLGIPSTQFAIWIYSLWTKLSIVPESCLGSRWTSPFSLQGYPGTGNVEFSAALDLEGGADKTDLVQIGPLTTNLHHRQRLKGWCVLDSTICLHGSARHCFCWGLLVPDPCLAQVACQVQGELGGGTGQSALATGSTWHVSTTQEPPTDCGSKSSSVSVSRENSRRLRPGTCAGRRWSRREREQRHSEWSGVAAQRTWLPSVTRNSGGKTLHSPALGAAAKGIKAFVTFHPL